MATLNPPAGSRPVFWEKSWRINYLIRPAGCLLLMSFGKRDDLNDNRPCIRKVTRNRMTSNLFAWRDCTLAVCSRADNRVTVIITLVGSPRDCQRSQCQWLSNMTYRARATVIYERLPVNEASGRVIRGIFSVSCKIFLNDGYTYLYIGPSFIGKLTTNPPNTAVILPPQCWLSLY